MPLVKRAMRLERVTLEWSVWRQLKRMATFRSSSSAMLNNLLVSELASSKRRRGWTKERNVIVVVVIFEEKNSMFQRCKLSSKRRTPEHARMFLIWGSNLTQAHLLRRSVVREKVKICEGNEKEESGGQDHNHHGDVVRVERHQSLRWPGSDKQCVIKIYHLWKWR